MPALTEKPLLAAYKSYEGLLGYFGAIGADGHWHARPEIADWCTMVELPFPTASVGHGFDGQPLGSNASTSPYYTGSQINSLSTKVVAIRIHQAGTSIPENKKVRVVITCGVHGRELSPPEAVCYFLAQIVSKYPDNTFVSNSFNYVQKGQPEFRIVDYKLPIGLLRDIITHLDLYFVPVVNPDAYNFILTPQSVSGDTNKQQRMRELWRTNRRNLLTDINQARNNTSPAKVNISNIVFNNQPGANFRINNVASVKTASGDTNAAPLLYPIGVDLNRNADIGWKGYTFYDGQAIRDNDSSADVSDYEGFRGPDAASEAETLNVVELLRYATPRSTATSAASANYIGSLYYIDIHTAARCIFLPWQFESNRLTAVPAFPLSTVLTEISKQNFQNSNFNSVGNTPDSKLGPVPAANPAVGNTLPKRRDGLVAGGNRYQEFYPNPFHFVGSSNNKHKVELSAKISKLARNMVSHIRTGLNVTFAKGIGPQGTKTAFQNLEATKPLPIVGVYAGERGIAAGTLVDYAFSLNFKYNASNVYEEALRDGPVVAMCFEAGSIDDDGFNPIDVKKYEPSSNKPPVILNHYQKVEREIWLGLERFLQSAVNDCKEKLKQ